MDSMKRHRAPADLGERPSVDLDGAATVGELAELEGGWTPDQYSSILAGHIRSDRVSLAAQMERLKALSQIGASADKAAAEELARHALVLGALFETMARAAAEALFEGGPRGVDAAQRLTGAAIRAQRATVLCLGALKALRDLTPTTATALMGRLDPDSSNV